MSRAGQSSPRDIIVIVLATLIGLGMTVATAPRRAPLVLLDVAVEGRDGKIVAGLTRDDFEILTGGAVRPIESFAAGQEQPLSLVLLFDASVSIEYMVKRGVLKTAVEKWFVPNLAAKDRVQVGSFSKQIAIGLPLAGNAKAILAAVRTALDPRDADAFGPSPVWDGVDAAVAALAQANGRRAVVLVTDGRATGNRRGAAEAGAHAIAEGVLVSVLGEDWEMTIRQDGTTGVRVRPGVALEWIANETGGLYLQDRSEPPAPGGILERLLADLHGRYTLGFTAPDLDGLVHPVEVRSKRPDVKIRARRSYVAPGATG